MLSSDLPQYTGIAFLEMYLADADSKHPAEAATVGHGSMFSLGDYNGILAQRNSDGKIRVYAVLSVPEAWPKEHEKEYDWSNPSGDARAKLLSNFFKDWAPELRALIANSSGDSGIWPRPIYALPTGHRWSHTPGITAIGDAAHVISPFAGAGANLAMLDGAKLGEAIAEGVANGSGVALEESIQKFEEWMFERAGLSAAEAEQNLKVWLQEKDGAQKMADKFMQLLKKP
jgi:2-polyprenyl-6-methoxyphenol hydroxylase-like FAD-dependent oxidoreductase